MTNLSKIHELDFADYLVMKQGKQSVEPFSKPNLIELHLFCKLKANVDPSQELALLNFNHCLKTINLDKQQTYGVKLTTVR